LGQDGRDLGERQAYDLGGEPDGNSAAREIGTFTARTKRSQPQDGAANSRKAETTHDGYLEQQRVSAEALGCSGAQLAEN
jgi:hypothetical protein